MKKIFMFLLLILLFAACTESEEPMSSNAELETEVRSDSSETTAPEDPTEIEDSETDLAEPIIELTATEKAALEGKREVFEAYELLAVRDNNLIDDAGKRTHVVYLPPSYYESNQSYPVIYYFHGFNGNSLDIRTVRLRSDALMASGDLKECIIIAFNYSNNLGGTFLENSPVTGNWEDGFIHEFMPYIDATYRTIPVKEARGLTGFSMGGYASTALALKHPDLFNVVYGMGPGLLNDDELSNAMGTWSQQFKEAYGSAFCPMPERQVKYRIPALNGHDNDKQVIDQWLNGFGHFDDKIADYLDQDQRLEAIGLEVADNDTFPWITSGTLAFSELLNASSIDHTLHVNQLGHTMNAEMFADRAINFLDDYLITE